MSSPITTNTTAAAWSPDIVAFPAADVIPDSLILSTSTVAGEIQGDSPVIRVPFVRDDTATFTAEGAEIDHANPVLAEVTVGTGKVATVVRVSREQFLQAGTAGMLSDSMRRAVVKASNAAYLTQPEPIGPDTTPPAGILTDPDIVTANDDVADNLDVLVDLVAQLESNGATPSGILLAPDAWAAIRKIKTGTGSAATLLGAGTADAEQALLGLPVMTSSAVPAGTGFIYDRASIVSAVSNVEVATNDSAFFTSDSVALRVVFRFGARMVRPDRCATFEVASA